MTFRVSPILCERPETAGIKCSAILRDLRQRTLYCVRDLRQLVLTAALYWGTWDNWNTTLCERLETMNTILCERLETAGINCSTILRDKTTGTLYCVRDLRQPVSTAPLYRETWDNEHYTVWETWDSWYQQLHYTERRENWNTILCERLETAGINCSTVLRDLR